MRRLGWMLMIALAPALGAQEQSDSGALPTADAAQAEQLRREIRQRWNEHVRSTLGLSDDQTGQVQATEQRFEQQRQPVRARQRQINQTLNAELSAGTPNEDRVKQLMTARHAWAISRRGGVAERISNPRQCESDQPITDTTSHAGQRMLMDRSESGARLAQRGQTP